MSSMDPKIARAMGVESRAAKTVRAPMKYPGSKYSSLDEIMPHLPYRGAYIEVFGGSGTVLLNRKKSKLEVYNDRFGGICAFYRALRSRPKDLVDRLELTVHSREDWEWCKATWDDDQLDDVERAARWYYSQQYSFAGMGRHFGRIVKPTSGVAGVIPRKLNSFWGIHQRLQNVQIENLDWTECLKDYDSADAVFYLDPPYLNSDQFGYKCKMSVKDHAEMCEMIMGMKGHVVLSGYPNEVYKDYKWSNIFSWGRRDRANSLGASEFNNRDEESIVPRSIVTEMLWIKE